MLIVSPNFATTTYKPLYTVPASLTGMPLSLNIIQANPVPFTIIAAVVAVALLYPVFKRRR